MKILLTGCNGQVGWELRRLLPELGEVVATDRRSLDLANLDAIRTVVREVKPDVIVNAAAYTAVDKAEAEPDLAARINGIAPGILAEEAKRLGALLVHYSTDYVFDGTKDVPYLEDDAPNPLNVYGQTKLAGERAIQDAGGRYLIFRTSWVYAARGQNFLLTMLRMAGEGGPLRVVNDQFGAPTSAQALAQATVAVLGRSPPSGQIVHMTCEGATSWHGFAEQIMKLAALAVQVQPIVAAEFPRPARRPANSRLDCAKLHHALGVSLPAWQEALRATMDALGSRASVAR